MWVQYLTSLILGTYLELAAVTSDKSLQCLDVATPILRYFGISWDILKNLFSQVILRLWTEFQSPILPLTGEKNCWWPWCLTYFSVHLILKCQNPNIFYLNVLDFWLMFKSLTEKFVLYCKSFIVLYSLMIKIS